MTALLCLAVAALALAGLAVWRALLMAERVAAHFPKIARAEIYQLAHVIYLAQNLKEAEAVRKMKDKAERDSDLVGGDGLPSDLHERPAGADEDEWQAALDYADEHGCPVVIALQHLRAEKEVAGLEPVM